MIHQYINNGYYIVLDVNSGSVHAVDALLYDVIQVLSERVEDMEKPRALSDEERQAVRDALFPGIPGKGFPRHWPMSRSSSTRRNFSPRIFTKTMW